MIVQAKSEKRRLLTPGDPMYAIRRTEQNQAGTGGAWRVALMRFHVRYGARFADGSYGTVAEALLAAQAFRDALLTRLGASALAPSASKRFAAIGKARVCQSIINGKQYWTAKYRTLDRQYCRRFSVDRFGASTAYRLAVEASIRLEQQYGAGCSAPSVPSQTDVGQIKQQIRAQRRVAPDSGKRRQTPYKEDAMYGIYRHESSAAGTGGNWRVAIVRQRRTFEKRFSDLAYGGKEPALIAARQYRDEVHAAVKPLSRRERQDILKSNNSSGVPGVHQYRSRGHEFWVAKIRYDGKTKVGRFNIATYGAEVAFDMAVNARKQMLAQVEGDYVFSPAAKTRSADVMELCCRANVDACVCDSRAIGLMRSHDKAIEVPTENAYG